MSNERLNTALMVIVILLLGLMILPGKMTIEMALIEKGDPRVAENSQLAGKEVVWFNSYKEFFGVKVMRLGCGIVTVTA